MKVRSVGRTPALLILLALALIMWGCGLKIAESVDETVGKVSGTVYREHEGPIVGAEVVLNGSSTLTDDDGNFVIENVPYNDYTIIVTVDEIEYVYSVRVDKPEVAGIEIIVSDRYYHGDLGFEPGDDGFPPGWTAQRGSQGRELNFVSGAGMSGGWAFNLVKDETMERNGRLRSRTIPVTSNATYQASVWLKIVEGNARLYIHFVDEDDEILSSGTVTETEVGEWVQLSTTRTAPENAVAAALRLDATSDPTDVYFDQVELTLVEP